MDNQNLKEVADHSGEVKKKINVIRGLSVFSGVLLLVIAFLIYSNVQLKEQIKKHTTTISTRDAEVVIKTNELAHLRLEFERVREEREALGLNNDSLNTQIKKLDIFIRDLKRANTISSQKRLELDEMVAKLRDDLTRKDVEISRLTQINDSLGRTVESERNRLGDSITTLKTSRSRLQQKVNLASILTAEEVSISTINHKGKEKERDNDKYKAKNIDKIKVAFKVGENKVTEPGEKDIMVSIIEPNGSTAYDLSNGGGIFDAEGKKAYYTIRSSVDYKNKPEQIILFYDAYGELSPGKYSILIYVDGYKAGESSLVVR